MRLKVTMASIRLSSVWKRYGEVNAVRELTLDCPQGEMLALLGPSGCGKSSTLKMVAGIESISAGDIFFDDRAVSTLSPAARDIAMVFEDYALYPHLTVHQNIVFPLVIRGVEKRVREERVAEVISILDLTAIANSGVRGLSGGAQQRVAIGRALVRDPELILFDEPLSHLDGDQKVQLRGEIKRLQSIAGTTSILVTHDQTEATAMADRIAVMNHGELQQVGPPEVLYSRPANLFVAEFIGEPPMNQFQATMSRTGDIARLAGEGWSLAAGDAIAEAVERRGIASLSIGVRPEHVAVRPLSETSDPVSGLRARVVCREPRGDTDIITLLLHTSDWRPTSQRIVAEIPGPSRLRDGDKAELSVQPGRLHPFETATGQRIQTGAL
jgi:ABC-type sugar transport system ATPase subunit